MSAYTVKPLDESTFPDFAQAVEKNKIWGGCWCLAFHGTPGEPAETTKEAKACRVREGRTHAALVYEGEDCVGWCQFGRTEELQRIKHRKQYEQEMEDLPDWRITCFVVDKGHRRRGVAELSLKGALEEIERQGGGVVESYPQDVEGRKVSGSFLYNATLGLFEKCGFSRVRRLGKNHWVVRKSLPK